MNIHDLSLKQLCYMRKLGQNYSGNGGNDIVKEAEEEIEQRGKSIDFCSDTGDNIPVNDAYALQRYFEDCCRDNEINKTANHTPTNNSFDKLYGTTNNILGKIQFLLFCITILLCLLVYRHW